MSPLIIFGVLLLFGVVLVIFGLTRSTQTDAIGDRLSQFTERTMTLSELELQQPFSQRVLIPLARTILGVLGKYGPKQSAERLRLNLQQAGNPGNLTPVMYSGIRIVLAGLLLVIFGFVTFRTMAFTQALMYTAIGRGLGYLLP